MKYGKIKTVLFSLLPMTLLLILLEVIFALFGIGEPFNRASRFWSEGMDFALPDKYTGFRMKPGYDNGMLKINSLGFRDDEFDSSADFKVLVLGDSCAFGWKVDRTEDTYPALLEKMLNRHLIRNSVDRKVEVLNAGTPSYTAYQGLQLYLRQLAALSKWDEVVVSFGWNERPEGELDLEFALRNPPFENQLIQSLQDIARHLRLYNAMESLFYRISRNMTKDPYLLAESQYQEYYGQLIRSARRNGAHVIASAVITLPGDKSPLSERMRKFNAIAKKVALSEGAFWIDLNDRFVSARNEIRWYDYYHYDGTGDMLVANSLAELIMPNINTLK